MDKTEKRDLEGYAFIRNQIVHTGVTPSLREIAKAIGYSSPRSIQLMLTRLEKRGLLKRVGGVIRLSPRKVSASSEKTIEVPLVGAVACGAPTLAEQDPEALITISTKIARPGHAYFILRARGTSMNRAGIHDGDLVLIRQQATAERGDKIVALVDDSATIKRFYPESDLVILKPDSSDKNHKPIIVSDELAIQGVVVATLPADLY